MRISICASTRMSLLKYLIIIFAHVSCENLPLRNIRFDAEVPYTCYAVESITHNLPLDNEITDRLNRICSFEDSHEFFQYYLIAVNRELPNEGTAVDVPFESPRVRVTHFNGNVFELKVSEMANGTWQIICRFRSTPLATGQALFNRLYSEKMRDTRIFPPPFTILAIRKHPKFPTFHHPYSFETFVHREEDDEDTTFIFTTSRESIANPVLIVSNGKFKITKVNVIAKRVMLHVVGDVHPYVLLFEREDKTLDFSLALTYHALKG